MDNKERTLLTISELEDRMVERSMGKREGEKSCLTCLGG